MGTVGLALFSQQDTEVQHYSRRTCVLVEHFNLLHIYVLLPLVRSDWPGRGNSGLGSAQLRRDH